ncbi:hypothetical protein EVAR_60948_1 [Eumeta japonica]|uniref:Uncharacterized protein n=1 Tax=Eumeta variegata TaxID=151549 RepID=A0A4C1XSM3_EUMVA|nr:hypothetical protein EVAR_60948_1 [Eumeta japonica]
MDIEVSGHFLLVGLTARGQRPSEYCPSHVARGPNVVIIRRGAIWLTDLTKSNWHWESHVARRTVNHFGEEKSPNGDSELDSKTYDAPLGGLTTWYKLQATVGFKWPRVERREIPGEDLFSAVNN